MSDISNLCVEVSGQLVEVKNVNTVLVKRGNTVLNWWGSDPIISTQIFNTSRGKVVAQKVSYLKGTDETKYGYFEDRIPVEKSKFAQQLPNPAIYTKPYRIPVEKYPVSEVYLVRRAITEKEKRGLAEVLRKECEEYGKLNFF